VRGERDWLRPLPNGKSISALGFGCSSVWSQHHFPEADALAMLDAALAEGINHLDTSPSYADGERRLGLFLRRQQASRLVLSTKVGSNVVDGRPIRSFEPAVMRASFEQSLQRLGVEHVDILYLHGPAVADLNNATFAFFETLKLEGRITWSGVNSFDGRVLDTVVTTPIDAVMLQFNVTDLSATGSMERLRRAGKIIISGTALGRAVYLPSAFLPRDRASLWYLLRLLRKNPRQLLAGARTGRALAATGKPPTQAAIQFVTSHPDIVSNLFGTSRLPHLIANARAGHGTLDEADRLRLMRRA
jgi:aryl-alcohol dehydrogenase-like predicted oxidoreductase